MDFHKKLKPTINTPQEKMISLEMQWKRDINKLFLTNQWDQLPEAEAYSNKHLMVEHLEMYFLSREMFIKSAWLSSVTIRLVQFRVKY